MKNQRTTATLYCLSSNLVFLHAQHARGDVSAKAHALVDMRLAPAVLREIDEQRRVGAGRQKGSQSSRRESFVRIVLYDDKWVWRRVKQEEKIKITKQFHYYYYIIIIIIIEEMDELEQVPTQDHSLGACRVQNLSVCSTAHPMPCCWQKVPWAWQSTLPTRASPRSRRAASRSCGSSSIHGPHHGA